MVPAEQPDNPVHVRTWIFCPDHPTRTDRTSVYTCPFVRWFELANSTRGIEVWVLAAHSRRVPSAKAEVLDVPAAQRDGIGWSAHLIIRSAVIPNMMVSAMIWPEHARVLSEYRRGDGGGKHNNGAENFELSGHGGLR
jgi:hypothetical protein